jgi:hypothetical protein
VGYGLWQSNLASRSVQHHGDCSIASSFHLALDPRLHIRTHNAPRSQILHLPQNHLAGQPDERHAPTPPSFTSTARPGGYAEAQADALPANMLFFNMLSTFTAIFPIGVDVFALA